LLLSTSGAALAFDTPEDRRAFLQQHEIVGIYNDSTICFNSKTGDFWSVLKNRRFLVTRSEVRKMGLNTSSYKRVGK
jgi:hypothetical protein